MVFASHDSVFPLIAGSCGLIFLVAAMFKRWNRYLLDLHNPDGLDWHYSMPEKYGHVARLKGGFFGADALYITDPAALSSILIRQQAWFPESTEFAGLFGIVHSGDGVASVKGREHRKQRKHMNALFTANRVSKLTALFYAVTRQLQSKLATAVAGKPPGQVVDMFDYLTRTTLELVGTAGIGHTFNSFDDKSKAFEEFHGAITSVLPLGSRMFLVLPFLESWRRMKPVWLRRTLASIAAFFWPTVAKFRAAIYSMHPVYVQIYKARQRLLEEGGSAALTETAADGKDLMSSMIQANWDADEADKMPDDVVLANMGSIVHGGQETTSSSLARFLTIVAEDSDLQQKLRAELQNAKAKKAPGEDLDYVEIEKLPILDAVVREMLRVYSPVTFIWRQTTKDVVVPLTHPIRSTTTGEEINEMLIEQGTAVYLGLAAANRSTAVWGPDASEFKPERWLNRTQTESKLPGAYSGMMTFLSGAKVCPGRIFAIFEMKLILSELLLAFSFDPVSEPIDWKMGIAIEPRVRGREKEGLQVPVRITVLQQVNNLRGAAPVREV
ncbi:cytochrome P450 [Mycena albidolilacea]|uniref:Cytochrome P450 n=1 Tax=Mycena albidolilacea TaxID=1033008 RepID=A0AAD6YZY1_9AGAR|nr:cytochrome P450 [Mycena albidolilacea]